MNIVVPYTLASPGTSDCESGLASKDRLTACSSYFDALFNGPMSKPHRGDPHVPGASTESLYAIVPYCSMAHALVTLENVRDLPIGAEHLPAGNLPDGCCACISCDMDVGNFIVVLEMVASHHFESPHNSAVRFLLDNIELVHKENPGSLQFSLTDLADLLGSVVLKVRREEFVWEASVLWIKAICKVRRQCPDTPLPNVRLGLMKSSYPRKVIMLTSFVDMPNKTKVQVCYDLKFGRDTCLSDSARQCSFPVELLLRPRLNSVVG